MLPERLLAAWKAKRIKPGPWPLEDVAHRGALDRDNVHGKRIVVATLVTAGKLLSIGVSLDHFTHVFIDEAGQANEVETLIPVSRLLNRYVVVYHLVYIPSSTENRLNCASYKNVH